MHDDALRRHGGVGQGEVEVPHAQVGGRGRSGRLARTHTRQTRAGRARAAEPSCRTAALPFWLRRDTARCRRWLTSSRNRRMAFELPMMP